MQSHSSNTSGYTSIKEVEGIFIAKLNSEGIIEVELSNKNEEIGVQDLVLLKNAIMELGGGKKMPIFIRSNDFLGISSEARTYAASKESGEFTLANAVLVNSLANKLLFNFFLKINKPIVATKGFTDQESAFEWLRKIK